MPHELSDLLIALSLLCAPIMTLGVAIGIARRIGWQGTESGARITVDDQAAALADLQYRLSRLEQSAEQIAATVRLLADAGQANQLPGSPR